MAWESNDGTFNTIVSETAWVERCGRACPAATKAPCILKIEITTKFSLRLRYHSVRLPTQRSVSEFHCYPENCALLQVFRLPMRIVIPPVLHASLSKLGTCFITASRQTLDPSRKLLLKGTEGFFIGHKNDWNSKPLPCVSDVRMRTTSLHCVGFKLYAQS